MEIITTAGIQEMKLPAFSKSINGNLKRIGDELVILQMHTAYHPSQLNETDQKEEE